MLRKISSLMFALLFSCSNVFAAMNIEGRSGNISSDPHSPFYGKIHFVDYFYRYNKPAISVVLNGENNEYLQMTFTGDDLPAGIALLSATGKLMYVTFADANFTVSSIFIRDNSDNNNDIKVLNKLHVK